MAKHGKGKLRAALDRHNARRQQAVEERKRAEAREAMQRNKAASVRRGGAAPTQQAQKLVEPFAPDDTVLVVGESTWCRRKTPTHMQLPSPSRLLFCAADTRRTSCLRRAVTRRTSATNDTLMPRRMWSRSVRLLGHMQQLLLHSAWMSVRCMRATW